MNDTEMIDALYASLYSHTSVRVNLAKLLTLLDGSCDVEDHDNWLAAAFVEKICDDQMSYLIDSILEEGMLCPLNIISSYWGFTFGNGHHRLIAALLCGIEEIDVVVTEGIDWKRTEIHDDWDFEEIVRNYNVSYADAFDEIFGDMLELIQEEDALKLADYA